MKGKIQSVRIWNVTLDQNAINNLDLTTANTINKDNIILDLDFTNLPDLLSKGTFSGSSYTYLLDE